MPNTSTLQQVRLARKGDSAAFQALIHAEKDKLYRIAYLYTHNEQDALEVFQETVYQAFRYITTLKQEKYFSTWLTRILINNALDWIGKNKRAVPMIPEMVKDLQAPPTHPDPEVRLDLIQALKQLEEKYKTVLLLRYYRDYTVAQIAEVLECPEGTVKTNINRGLIQLRKQMKGVYQDERTTTFFQTGD